MLWCVCSFLLKLFHSYPHCKIRTIVSNDEPLICLFLLFHRDFASNAIQSLPERIFATLTSLTDLWAMFSFFCQCCIGRDDSLAINRTIILKFHLESWANASVWSGIKTGKPAKNQIQGLRNRRILLMSLPVFFLIKAGIHMKAVFWLGIMLL